MSAIIGIRRDECGREFARPFFAKCHEDMAVEEAIKAGWIVQDDGDDICPFCVARCEAKQQAEAKSTAPMKSRSEAVRELVEGRE